MVYVPAAIVPCPFPMPVAFGTVIFTPPSRSVSRANPVKSVTTMWSIVTPVSDSTVWIARAGPPQLKAALILATPWPGIGTQLSRGIETTYAPDRSAGMWTSMIASVRWAPVSHWDGSPAEIRLSEPNTRRFIASVGPVDAALVGRPAGGIEANGSPDRES